MLLGTGTLLLLLWGYVATSRYYLVGSLQIGDIIALLCLALLVLSPRDERAFLDFFRGAYGWVVGAASIVVLAVALPQPAPLVNLTFAVQFAYTFWIVVPLVALSVAHAADPFRTLERAAWLFLLGYLAGAILLFVFGRTWVLYMTGIGRVFSHYVFAVFQQVAASIAVVQLVRRRGNMWRYIGLLVLAAVPVVLSASRTGMLILVLLTTVGVLGSIRSVRGMLSAAAGAVLLGLVLTSSTLQESLGVRVLQANALLQDSERMHAVASTLERVQLHPEALLWGLGWGNSGEGLVVHNLVIQLAAEGGVLSCVLVLALLAVPWLWCLQRRQDAQAEAAMAALLTLVVWLNWLLNAFPIERVYWLPIGVAFGFAYRGRRAPETSPTLTVQAAQ
jgi:O-antigen ligase